MTFRPLEKLVRCRMFLERQSCPSTLTSSHLFLTSSSRKRRHRRKIGFRRHKFAEKNWKYEVPITQKCYGRIPESFYEMIQFLKTLKLKRFSEKCETELLSTPDQVRIANTECVSSTVRGRSDWSLSDWEAFGRTGSRLSGCPQGPVQPRGTYFSRRL